MYLSLYRFITYLYTNVKNNIIQNWSLYLHDIIIITTTIPLVVVPFFNLINNGNFTYSGFWAWYLPILLKIIFLSYIILELYIYIKKIYNKKLFYNRTLCCLLIILLLLCIIFFWNICTLLYFFVCPLPPILRSLPIPVDYELHEKFFNFICKFELSNVHFKLCNECVMQSLYNSKSTLQIIKIDIEYLRSFQTILYHIIFPVPRFIIIDQNYLDFYYLMHYLRVKNLYIRLTVYSNNKPSLFWSETFHILEYYYEILTKFIFIKIILIYYSIILFFISYYIFWKFLIFKSIDYKILDYVITIISIYFLYTIFIFSFLILDLATSIFYVFF